MGRERCNPPAEKLSRSPWERGLGRGAFYSRGSMTIRRIGVIGAGTMGNGIAQAFAQAGYDVMLQDVSPAALDRARATIDKSLAKFVEKGKLSAEARDAALARLQTAPRVEALNDVDYVVE